MKRSKTSPPDNSFGVEKKSQPSHNGRVYTAKRFRDEVYGHIELPAICIAFMDTPQFQRLRQLKQLGAGYFVFPGASHNRFEHCIGVAYLSGVLMRKIQSSQPELEISTMDIELVQLAGLLHDLGHGPFSHLFENGFLPHFDLKVSHEEMTLLLLDYLVKDNALDLYALFHYDHDESLRFIRSSISGKNRPIEGKNLFRYEVIHNVRNGMDMDRLDYFERDALNTGMKSSCDVQRLLSEVRVIDDCMCFPDKLVGDVLAAYATRFSLFQAVYSHKVVKAIELMIIDALVLADSAGGVFSFGANNLSLKDSVLCPAAYCETNDDVLQQIKRSKAKSALPARTLLHRLEKRILYQCVGEFPNPLPLLREDQWVELLLSTKASMTSETSLTGTDVRIDKKQIHYGSLGRNPVDEVLFYSKSQLYESHVLGHDVYACPATFMIESIRVYCTQSENTLVLSTLSQALKEVRQHQAWMRFNQ